MLFNCWKSFRSISSFSIEKNLYSRLLRKGSHVDRVAVVSNGHQFTYRRLLQDISTIPKISHGYGKIVGMLFPNNYNYVVSMYSIWKQGHVALPLFPGHPLAEMRYMLQDSGSDSLLVDSKYVNIARELGLPFQVVSNDSLPDSSVSEPVAESRYNEDALIVYTSGTTGKPKGVLHTHKSLFAQVESLRHAWEIGESDRILHCLPLHHIHGIVNALLCPLYCGASVEFLLNTQNMEKFKTFDAEQNWNILSIGDISVFMAVPSIYKSLIENLEYLPLDQQNYIRQKLVDSQLRLCISGSSALPQTLFEKWRDFVFAFENSNDSRKLILERYGMTETGMILGNPLLGDRLPSTVGKPMPGVEVKLNNSTSDESEMGELLVKSDCIFKKYVNRPQETTDKEFVEFTSQTGGIEKWFKTGDMARRLPNGYHQIQGRLSVDILKVKGYKVSALEIEQEIMKSKSLNVSECAVVADSAADQDGVDDQIIAVLALSKSSKADKSQIETELKRELSIRLAYYKLPRRVIIVDKIPRNALGKVNKKTLLNDISNTINS